MIEKVISVCALILIALACLLIFFLKMREFLLFKSGRNPYERICEKCGAYQQEFQSNIEGEEHVTWWEEVTPGNDWACRCRKYSNYRN